MNCTWFLAVIIMLLAACKSSETPSSDVAAFTGAVLIDGTGADPVEDAVLLVQSGKIIEAGPHRSVSIPAGATVSDLSGKTIIPGIINGHGHVGHTRGIEGGHYSRENIIDNLKIYARYGITTVVSLGDDKAEAVSLRHEIDSAVSGRARLFIAGAVITGKTPEEALEVVDANHRMGVDFMKIRVDDNLGTGVKMPEEVFKAVIDKSHELGYRIATHMYYLDDASKLLDAGSDLIAHSVRDVNVHEAFIHRITNERVGYCPTLTRELSTFAYAGVPEFFGDPFFSREYDENTVKPLKDPERQREVKSSRAARIYKQQLPVAMANLKTLSDAGVPIIFGTDSGVPTRFMGYFEHLEMEMMQDAGLTPMQILVSATRNPAEYLGLENLGTLRPGNWADFIVLDADPLEDVKNIRKISQVFVGGEAVPR